MVYSAGQRKVLAELGIELWVRRGLNPGLAPGSAGAAEKAEVAQTPEPVVPAAVVEAPPVILDNAGSARFELELQGLRGAGVLVTGELPLGEDRLLARDVLAAVSGGRVADAAQAPFSWPQSNRGEQGEAAAATALQAFLRGQAERDGVRVIVILGDAARRLLFPALGGGDQLAEFAGCACVLTGSAAELRLAPDRKRDLWQIVLTIPSSA